MAIRLALIGWASMVWLVATAGAVTIDPDFRPTPPAGMPSPGNGEKAIREATPNLLPGNRLILGRIVAIRSGEFEVDIGNLQLIYLPAKPAQEKKQHFAVGDPVVITMNDHNAVVDYHHPNEPSHHRVLKGRLTTPLTVGLDKAVVATDAGTTTFEIAERAKGKLGAIPVGVEAWFLADETGALVDAQLGSEQAVEESARNNKARLLGAHERHRARFDRQTANDRIRVTEDGKSKEFPVRPPLPKLEQLQKGDEIVLLLDEQGYVLDIATAPYAVPQ